MTKIAEEGTWTGLMGLGGGSVDCDVISYFVASWPSEKKNYRLPQKKQEQQEQEQ